MLDHYYHYHYHFYYFLLQYPGPIRNLLIRPGQDHVSFSRDRSEDQDLRLESGNPFREKVGHGKDLPANEILRFIPSGDLGAGPFNANRSKVDGEFKSGAPRLGKHLGRENGADSDFYFFEIGPGDG